MEREGKKAKKEGRDIDRVGKLKGEREMEGSGNRKEGQRGREMKREFRLKRKRENEGRVKEER